MAGYDVSLVVADGLGDGTDANVRIKDTGKASGRLSRMVGSAYRVYAAGLKLNADLYHLHDPELLPYALALKARGKRVIFDAHENLPAQILTKPYLKPVLRRSISRAVDLGENWIALRLDAVVGATPTIEKKFERVGVSRAENISNFPLMGELESPPQMTTARNGVCYVGGASRIRGIVELVQAMDRAHDGTQLTIAGRFQPESLRDEVATLPGWKRVALLGFVDRTGVRDLMAGCVAGIVTFLPVPNHIDAQPNKMFEYMSAGLPVIASDFPLWRQIIAGNDCGLLVDPENPQDIADAIDALVRDPEMARRMGENGSRAVKEKYNWGVEEKKLLALYSELIGSPHGEA